MPLQIVSGIKKGDMLLLESVSGNKRVTVIRYWDVAPVFTPKYLTALAV